MDFYALCIFAIMLKTPYNLAFSHFAPWGYFLIISFIVFLFALHFNFFAVLHIHKTVLFLEPSFLKFSGRILRVLHLLDQSDCFIYTHAVVFNCFYDFLYLSF